MPRSLAHTTPDQMMTSISVLKLRLIFDENDTFSVPYVQLFALNHPTNISSCHGRKTAAPTVALMEDFLSFSSF